MAQGVASGFAARCRQQLPHAADLHRPRHAAHYSSDALAASMAGAMVFWTLFTLPQSTAAYATTFVAQYVGAGRPERVGPAIWQVTARSAGCSFC
ncbi:MAG: MATE family efflux transporter [Gemmataceae bacterium]